MAKRVVLRLGGSVRSGIKVTVEIGREGESPEIELQGNLPPHPCLDDWARYWHETYRNLDLQTRLVSKQTIYNKSVTDLVKTCSTSALQFGEQMKAWLESVEFSKVDKRLRSVLNYKETIHVLIRAEDAQLAHFPWHLWDFFESYPKAEIAFSTATYRRINSKEKRVKDKVRILAILGSSTGIDIEADRAILSGYADAEIEFLVEPEREALNDQIWSQAWDILFFAGHSQTAEGKGYIHINPRDTLDVRDLRYCLKKAAENGLALVIFNSCDGLGLAYELEQLNIPQMIVMREPVPDRVAQKFLKHFLEAFTSGKTLYESVRDSRERLKILENECPCATWLPVIFQNPAEIAPTWRSLGGVVHRRKRTALAGSAGNKYSFQVSDIVPISKSNIVYTDRENKIIAEGQVLESICPNRVGRVKYGPSSWRAYLHPDFQHLDGIFEDEQVAVVGMIPPCTLVVAPLGFQIQQRQQNSNFSSLKWFSRWRISNV